MKRKKYLFVFLLLVLLSGIWTYFELTSWAPKRLLIREENIISSKIPESFNGLRIAFISDINGNIDLFEQAVASLNNHPVDAFVLMGNLFSSFPEGELLERYRHALAALNPSLGKYLVLSEKDYNLNMDLLSSLFSENDFTLLRNTALDFHNKGSEYIQLVGIDGNVGADEKESQFFPSINPDLFTLTFVHNPLIGSQINSSDYILSGMTLGGQIRLPLIGSVMTSNEFTFKRQGNHIIAMGLGVESERAWRLGTNPEIVILILNHE